MLGADQIALHHMNSETRINANTAHLIPTAAVWQSPQIIKALVDAGAKGLLVSLALFIAFSLGSQTPLFNPELRKAREQYELCMAKFKLQGSYTYDAYLITHNRCSAIAQINSIQNKTH